MIKLNKRKNGRIISEKEYRKKRCDLCADRVDRYTCKYITCIYHELDDKNGGNLLDQTV